MSGSEAVNPLVDDKLLAFEYVSGVLRGAERDTFLQRLQVSDTLQMEVAFWEEQLINMSEHELRKPDPEVWRGIEARLQQQDDHAPESMVRRFVGVWSNLVVWKSISACATVLLGACVWLLLSQDSLTQPNADYVAVLTNSSGAPQLTVLTATGGERLWLKWENVVIAPNKNVQLWAVSKRDGQTRPLGVFAQVDTLELPLTVANWRLIKDASHLILTEEDEGGSPLDEPSETILAKGVCVLLARVDKTI